MTRSRLFAVIVTVLIALFPSAMVAQEEMKPPYIQYVEVVANQYRIVGDGLYYEADENSETAISFTTTDGETETTYRFSSVADPAFGPMIGSYSEKEMSLRLGILPSTFTGTVVIHTPRGDSKPVEFSIDNPYCPVTDKMVSSLIGGEDAMWTATPSNWLFASDTPVPLFVPFVGTLTVPGDEQPVPVFLTQVETTTAVYDCTEVTMPRPVVSTQ